MGLIEILTPKDTEEVKPGLFIQKKGNSYRQITPAAWNGKINWKVAILGPNFIRNFIWFAIIMFIAWSYVHDNAEYRTFYDGRVSWCHNLTIIETQAPGCSEQNAKLGLCTNLSVNRYTLPSITINESR